MDDFDLLGITSPEGLAFVAASGVLDDDGEHCGCTCGCKRVVDRAGDRCDPCAGGRHGEPFDTNEER